MESSKKKQKQQEKGKNSGSNVAVPFADAGGGFKALKWRLPKSATALGTSISTDEAQNDICYEFFVKCHAVREYNARKPRGRTLFVINIPPFLSESNLRGLFLPFGEIGEIFIHQNPSIGLPAEVHPFFPDEDNIIRGYKVAYIVFSDPKSITTILESNNLQPLEVQDKIVSGLEKWIKEYNDSIIPVSVLEADVQEFMVNFESSEIQRLQEEKNNEGEPDDEGWVKVTRRGKRPGTMRTEHTEEKLKEKKRRFEKQLLNFTPTQIKETRAKELADLKKKFDEDKQRVALLRQSRKFKPF